MINGPVRSLLTRLRSAAGAIDLASILVGVLVMGVLGSVIAASVFVVIPWAQDSAARSSLDAVKTAQSVSRVKDGKFQDWSGLLASKYVTGSGTVDTVVNAAGDCYVSAAKSATGTSFYRTSRDNTVLDDKSGPPDTDWCVSSTRALADPVINLATNPGFSSAATGTNVVRTNLTPNPSLIGDAVQWYPNWNGNGAGAAVWDGTTPGALSGKSLKVTPSSNGAGVELTQTFPRLSDYRVSFYVKGASGVPASFGTAVHPGGVPMTAVGSSVDGWQRYASPTMTLYGAQDTTYINAFANTGQTFWISNVLVEQTDQLRDYFDGATIDALGMDYGWAGAAGTSASTARAAVVNVRSNLAANPGFENGLAGWSPTAGAVNTRVTSGAGIVSGAAAMEMTLGTLNQSGTAYSIPGVLPSTEYTGSASVTLISGDASSLSIHAADGLGTRSSLTIGGTLIVGQPVRVSLPWTSSTSPATASLRFWRAGASASGAVIRVDNVLIEQSATLGSYFDGSAPNTGDTVNEWSGVTGASSSVQQGARPAGTSSVYGTTIQSNSSGSTWVRQVPASSTAPTLTEYNMGAFVPGVEYTILVKSRLGASVPSTGRMYFGPRFVNGSALDSYADAPITAGTAENRHTFTVPAGTTSVLIRLYGSRLGDVDSYWDDLLIVEGVYTGPYFDGSSVNGAWNGAPNASTSTGWIRR